MSVPERERPPAGKGATSREPRVDAGPAPKASCGVLEQPAQLDADEECRGVPRPRTLRTEPVPHAEGERGNFQNTKGRNASLTSG